MSELDLRSLVRDAVARHLGAEKAAPVREPGGISSHIAHAIYLTVVNPSDECVIEPSVSCHHCGYCKTHGY